MRICLLSRFYYPLKTGGSEVFTFTLACLLAKRGHEVHVITQAQDKGESYQDEHGVFIHTVSFPTRSLPGFYVLACVAYFLKVAKLLKKLKPGVVHAMQTNFNGTFGGFITKFLGMKFIIHDHGNFYILPNWHKRFFAKRALKDASLVISPSRDLASSIEQFTGNKTMVIPNAIHPERYQGLERQEARQALSLPKNQPLLLFIGRLTELKRVDILISALALLAREHPDVKLVIVGGGTLETRLKEQVKMMGLEESVLFTGYVEEMKVPLYTSACDIFVLPSEVESFGIVLLEAMAAGRPCVASRVGGIPELIEDGVNGLLVESGKPDELATAILRVLNEPELAEKFGKNNLEKVKGFSWDEIASRFEEVYQKLGKKE